VLATVLVILLARSRTARWELDRTAADEALRRRRARERARMARGAMLATPSRFLAGRRRRQ
jgi:hypothetical protein